MHLLPMQVPMGDAMVSLFTLGVLRVDLAAWLPAAADAPPSLFAAAFAQPMLMPVVCAHIALPNLAIVVDCCNPALIPHTSYAPIDHDQPPPISEQMQALGIDPAAVEHVVLTHSHFDHICGLVVPEQAGDRMTFANARHYLGRGDWNQIVGNLADPDSLESRTLGLIHRAGVLHLLDSSHDLAAAIRIIPAPGETLGHQIVRLHSAGETLYCLGDLYHHQVEISAPDMSVHWADADLNRRNRAVLAEAMLLEDALVTAGHLVGFGRLRRTSSGVAWVSVETKSGTPDQG